VKVSAGTDATRVASYNPWVSLSWLVTGKTVGGLQSIRGGIASTAKWALRMWTDNVTWFSNEEGKKGTYRDRAAWRSDCTLKGLFILCRGGDRGPYSRSYGVRRPCLFYGAGDFARVDENPPPPAMPEWSPVSLVRWLRRMERIAGRCRDKGRERNVRPRMHASLQCAWARPHQGMEREPPHPGYEVFLGRLWVARVGRYEHGNRTRQREPARDARRDRCVCSITQSLCSWRECG